MKTPRTRLHRIRLGFGNSYIIQAQRGCIVIDAGSKNQQQLFVRHLEKNNLSGDQVRLIVITHVRFDHVGSLKAIKELCKCPVAVHERESQLLRDGGVVFPPGTNLYAKAASYIGQKVMRPLFRFPPVEPDFIISEDFSLEPFGIPGDIIPTPSHTAGSLSFLLC
jgi:hydroxyacylglutathione hydrolase